MAKYISTTVSLSASSGSSVIPADKNTRYPASTISGVISISSVGFVAGLSRVGLSVVGWYVKG